MNAPTRMRVLRKEKGLTQGELAVATGIGQPVLSSIERGEALPGAARTRHLRTIAAVLGEEVPERLLERLPVQHEVHEGATRQEAPAVEDQSGPPLLEWLAQVERKLEGKS